MPKDFIAKYVGIPFKHMGRDMKGLDCWGLVKLIYKDLGYEINDLESYECQAHLKGQDCFTPYSHGIWQRSEQGKAYDVVLILDHNDIVFHAGVLLPYGKFIHTHNNTGVIIMDFQTIKRKCKIEGYYRMKEKND